MYQFEYMSQSALFFSDFQTYGIIYAFIAQHFTHEKCLLSAW